VSQPDPFAPHHVFAFPLFSTVLAGFEPHRQPLVDQILALRASNAGIVRSNRSAWHSGEEFLHHKSEHVAWVLEKILKFARLSLGRYYNNWASSELVLASSWANVLGPGGWNAPHHHHPCNWSGALYVSVPNVGTTPGDPSGMIEFLNPTPWLSGINQGGNFVYGPKEGLTLMFPASLYHFVHPHASETPRISIAYNLNVVPKVAR
jgi:uncharacterized protein (TIGR02466 family)